MANYNVDIAVALKGAKKLTDFNKTVGNTTNQIKSLEHQLKTASKQQGLLVRSFENLNKVLADAKTNFNAVASGTKLQEKAARQLIRAEKDLNKEYRQRDLLLQRLRGTGPMNLPGTGVGRDPVASSIERRRRKLMRGANKNSPHSRPIGPGEAVPANLRSPLPPRSDVFLSSPLPPRSPLPQRSSIEPGQSLFGQSVNIEGRSLQIQREQFELQSKLGQMEIRSLKNKRKDLTFEELITRNIEKQTKLEKSNEIMLSQSSRRRRQRILDNPFNRIRQGLTGRSRTARARRGQATSNALIGGAFPLLFGQGLGAAAGGAAGGGAGGLLGGQFGFALSLVGTAVGSSLDRMIQGLKEFGKALDTTEGALKMMTDRNLFSSKAIQKQAEALKRQGRQAELNELVTRDLGNSLGAVAVKDVQKFSTEMEELSRQFGILTTQFQILAAGPLAKVVDLINNVVGRQVLESRISNQLRALEKGDPKAFQQFIKDNPRSAKEFGLGLLSGTLKQQTPLGVVDTDVGPGGFKFGGRSDEQLQTLSGSLDSLLKRSGIDSNLGIGGGDADKVLQVLEAEEGNLRKKQDALQSSFGIESAIAVIKENNSHLDDKALNDLLTKARRQLEVNDKLKEENFSLQITLDLYNNIASSIENGIVSAIEGAIEGTRTLGDVARSVFTEIQRSLIRFGVNAFLGGLPGIGGFFRAEGGPVSRGRSYIVGERGPELFTPGSSGMITPNHQLGGGSTSVVVNVDASGSNVEGDEGEGRALGLALSAAIETELIKQKRPGGLLA